MDETNLITEHCSEKSSDRPEIQRVTTHIGALIKNIDLSKSLSTDDHRYVRQALAKHGVIFFQNQTLNTAQYEACAGQFGVLTRTTNLRKYRAAPGQEYTDVVKDLEGSDIISEVRKDPGSIRNIGGSWHMDQLFREQPIQEIMLLCRKIPTVGGDTLFLSMAAAYDNLSDGLKKTLEPLRAVHSWHGNGPPVPPATHPVVIAHRKSGRKSLYISPGYTTHFEGWTKEESAPLLEYLFNHADDPQWTCRFRWEEGSVAFWNNHQIWHYAVNDYHAGERVMHRIHINSVPFER